MPDPSLANIEIPMPVALAPGAHRFAFTIQGDAVPKGRARAVRRGKHLAIVTPKETKRFEDLVAWNAFEAWKGAPLIDQAPIVLDVKFIRTPPRTWSKKMTAAALAGRIRPGTKPDLDNLIKSITDGMNTVVYRDDALIWSIVASKVYGDPARIEICLTW